MKKSIIPILFVAFIFGCKKDSISNSNEKTCLKPKLNSNNQSVPIGGDEYTKWCSCADDCVTTTDKTCCERPVKTATNTALYNSFVNAFNNTDLPNYFTNNNVNALWPNFYTNEYSLIQGIINGNLKVIKFYNSITNQDNYLIGLSTQNYNQIYTNPLYTIGAI